MIEENLFDFIKHSGYKELLIRDYQELVKCVSEKLNKSTLILSGSILEAVLTEFFLMKCNNQSERNTILKLSLYQLIEKSQSENLISKRSKDLSSVIRDYRNYIHPAKEIRTKDSIDEESAKISFSLLKMILKEIQTNYENDYGHKAEIIYKKIFSDTSATAIFKELIENTNEMERGKLLELLLDGYLNANGTDQATRNFFIVYYDKLKPYLNGTQVKPYVEKLFIEVEQGSNHLAIIYFDIFGKELTLLKPSKKDTVIKYIYNAIGKAAYTSDNLLEYQYQNIFRHLNLYRETKYNKEQLMKLIISIVSYLDRKGENDWRYLSIFNQLILGIDESSLFDYIKKQVEGNKFIFFKDKLDEYNSLPF